jgi:hypothetical protein
MYHLQNKDRWRLFIEFDLLSIGGGGGGGF